MKSGLPLIIPSVFVVLKIVATHGKPFGKGCPKVSFDIIYRHALDQDEETLVFGTTTGNLYLSNDYGESWNCLNHNLPMVHCVKFI